MTRFIFLRKGPHSPGPLNFCRDAAIETVAQAAERDCAGVSKNLDTLAHLGYASDTLARPQLYRPGLAHGWRSVALVPFWGGTAEASGGNSHSRAKRSAKIRQAAGTVCSALKPFHRAAVGVCGPEDRNLLLEALQGRWGIGPAAAVRLPRMPIDRALELISDKLLLQNVKHFGLLRDRMKRPDMVATLLENPTMLAKVAATFDINNATLVNGTAEDLSRARLTVFEFDCAVGVHLPYHLLQLAQKLIRGHSIRGHSTERKGVDATLVMGWNGKKRRGRQKASEDEAISSVRGALLSGRGPLAAAKWWGSVEVLYFTEADQLLSVASAQVLASSAAMLNASNYVSPQRAMMRNDAAAGHKEFQGQGLTATVRDLWGQEVRGQEAASDPTERRQWRRRLTQGAEKKTPHGAHVRPAQHRATVAHEQRVAPAELFQRRLGGADRSSNWRMFSIENQCEPGAGEAGYLGPSGIHIAPSLFDAPSGNQRSLLRRNNPGSLSPFEAVNFS